MATLAPPMVRLVDEKTKNESWIPLVDDAGVALYPELRPKERPNMVRVAQGRHTTVKVLPKYTKRTTRQIMNGAKKRRASRTKGGLLSE
jgi:hypothetical protein